MTHLQKILVPTDFEHTSALALTYGREIARRFNATLTLVHVADEAFALSAGTEGSVTSFPRLEADLEQCVRRHIESLMSDDDRRAGTMPVVLISSTPADAIVEYARSAGVDLIVMGTHGRGNASPDTIGSVAERVVRTAPCPVVTVRHVAREFVVPADTIAASEAQISHDSC